MKKTKIWNCICIALMALLLILQFLPFWSYDGHTASIQAYVWFPDNYKELTAYLETALGKDYNITQFVFPMIAVMLTAAAGIVLSLLKWDSPGWKAIPMIGAVIGAWGFLSKPALHQGTTWVLQLILCIGIIATAVMTVIYSLREEE